MTLFLIAIILLNSSIIAYLWRENAKSKALHLQKTAALESIIVELLHNSKDKNEKIQLAEDIKERLRFTKNRLNADILTLQYEFIEALSKNKLIE